MTRKRLGCRCARGPLILVLSYVVGFATTLPPASASSHSDAPLSKQDPQTNLTDVYAFIGTKYNDPGIKVLNVVVNVHPFCEPGDGVTYDRFADDARYSIHITNPASGGTVIRYDFVFSSVNSGYKNPDTALSYGRGTETGVINDIDDARQNYTQRYSVARVVGNASTALGSNLLTAPPNVGSRVTPLYNGSDGFAVSGAADFASLDHYTQQAIHDLAAGVVAFAGPRDDSFYCDIPGIFDLINPRILDNDGVLFEPDGIGQDGHGVDGFKGFNVLTYALQIPVSSLQAVVGPFNSVFFGTQTGVGVYASVARQKIRVLNNDGSQSNQGPWIQLNRLGNPFFNEGFVAVRDKDKYNHTSPTGDATTFATYAANPELGYLINVVSFGNPSGQAPIVVTGRADLANIFIPDVLRVVTTTDPVPLDGQPGFHRLGFLAGDTTNGVSSGWPNGRRLGDDVADIALTALVNGPAYTPPLLIVGDNVLGNDIAYHRVFPYAATPHSGAANRKDPPSP